MAPASLTIKEINNLGFRVKGSWIEDKDLWIIGDHNSGFIVKGQRTML